MSTTRTRTSTSMTSFPLHIVVVLLLSFILLGNGDLVDETCKKTPSYALCSSVLNSNPQSPKSDTKGLALIMDNYIIANASATLSYTEDLIKQTKDEKLQQQLSFCAQSYIPVVKYILPQANDAINRGNYAFASYSINDAGKEITSCSKKLSNPTQPPLGDKNIITQKLLDVATAILKLLLNA